MGLFDSLKKNLSNLADEVVSHKDDLQKELQRFQSQQSSASGSAYSDPQAASPRFTTERKYPESYDQSSRIEEIILRNFPDYELQRNVRANALLPQAHPACEPISFLLCRDGRPRLAIVLTNVNRHSGMPLKGTDSACKAIGIPCMHLYHEYENSEGYIIYKVNSLIN